MDNISITESASIRIKNLLNDDMYKNDNMVALRIYVQGGGCSGFNYGFEFSETISEDDIVIEKNDIKIIIDPMSIMYLEGSVIDYKVDLMNNQFTILNPLAKSTCGCGQSFNM